MSVAAVALSTRAFVQPAMPRLVIARHVAGRALRGALIWGAVFGLFVIGTMKAFIAGYPTLDARLQLARSLQSFAMFLGEPRHAETVAGFTTWRILVVTATIGAVWGLMTSTGLLRGEEDDGRWELLLSGNTTRARATAEALLGLALAVAAMFAATAVLTLLAGQMPGAHFRLSGVLMFALALVSGAAMFVAVGALTSQLAASRGQAALLAAAVLIAAFLIRMVADSKGSLGWLRWFSPLGWLEELHPLQDVQPVALVPVLLLIATCVVGSVVLAARRDLQASVLHESANSGGDGRWLVGPLALTLRVSRPTLLAWLGGIALMAAMYGSLTRSASTFLSSSPTVVAALGRLGLRRANEGYLSVIFLMMAVFIALLAASQIAAMRDEEASGRLDNLLVRPVPRLSWFVKRLVLSSGVVVLSGVIAGFFGWWGASTQHIGADLPKLLAAGLNATVPALCALGAGALVFGVRPRLCAPLAYGLVAWSFLVNLLGSVIKGQDWIRDTSLFSHIKLAPAVSPDWGSALIMLGLALVAAAIGAAAFARRDIEYV